MINKIQKSIDRTSMIFKEAASLIKGGWGICYVVHYMVDFVVCTMF